MSDKRRKIIVFSILAIAIVWGIWNNPLSSKKETRQSEEQPAVRGEADIPDASEPAMNAAAAPDRSEESMLDGWKGDPFRRKIVSRTVAAPARINKDETLKLSAISTQGSNSMAIINGKVLSRDGVIDGWAVAEIDAESVLLVKGSRNLKLNLKRR